MTYLFLFLPLSLPGCFLSYFLYLTRKHFLFFSFHPFFFFLSFPTLLPLLRCIFLFSPNHIHSPFPCSLFLYLKFFSSLCSLVAISFFLHFVLHGAFNPLIFVLCVVHVISTCPFSSFIQESTFFFFLSFCLVN